MLKKCVRFSNFMACIKHGMQTGINMDDMVPLATAMYNDVNVTNVADDCVPAFRLLDFYKHVSRHSKFCTWQDENEERSRTVGDEGADNTASSIDETDGDNQGRTPGPIGRKKEKKAAERHVNNQRKLILALEALAARVKRNKTMKLAAHIQLFTFAPSGCDNSEAVEFFTLVRKKALQELRSEVGSSTNGDTKNAIANRLSGLCFCTLSQTPLIFLSDFSIVVTLLP